MLWWNFYLEELRIFLGHKTDKNNCLLEKL